MCRLNLPVPQESDLIMKITKARFQLESHTGLNSE